MQCFTIEHLIKKWYRSRKRWNIARTNIRFWTASKLKDSYHHHRYFYMWIKSHEFVGEGYNYMYVLITHYILFVDACLDVNQGGRNCNCCTQRLVTLHAQTYWCTLIVPVMSDLLYGSKSPAENRARVGASQPMGCVFTLVWTSLVIVGFSPWNYVQLSMATVVRWGEADRWWSWIRQWLLETVHAPINLVRFVWHITLFFGLWIKTSKFVNVLFRIFTFKN